MVKRMTEQIQSFESCKEPPASSFRKHLRHKEVTSVTTEHGAPQEAPAALCSSQDPLQQEPF